MITFKLLRPANTVSVNECRVLLRSFSIVLQATDENCEVGISKARPRKMLVEEMKSACDARHAIATKSPKTF